jgi:alpha-beta hydrolase superfamily lysophospholipase
MPEFDQIRIDLKPDFEGENVATVFQPKSRQRTAVLYLHGFIDYFFQEHVADWFEDQDISFYALELRKYGRSILPHQHPNHVRNIRDYYEEIDRTIELMVKNGHKNIIFFGHSTGGLIAMSYANNGEHRALINAYMLNSPFLELNLPFALRYVGVPIIRLFGKYFPEKKSIASVPSIYFKSMHVDHWGEWSFNLEWKPIDGFPVLLGWVRAIALEQKHLKQSSNVESPILLMHSSHSFLATRKSDRIFTSDIVLNVEHMKRYGRRLGRNVEIVEIKSAPHDILLGKPDVRKNAFKKMGKWISSLDLNS